MPFSSLGLSKALIEVIAEQNYAQPYPIQLEAIPAILKGKDLLGIARTGSGKTAGYVLPILEMLQHQEPTKNRYIKTLVLVPSRELAVQVGEVFQLFASRLPRKVKIRSVFGGVSVNPQMMQMIGTDILVATPGRLLDLVSSNAVKLSKVNTLVVDEADKMLNLGFKEEMNSIFTLLPAERQNLLFSATLSNEVITIKELLLKDPGIIRIDEEDTYIEHIRQVGYYIENERKGPLLRYLIKKENMQQVLVFVSSIKRADNVVNKLYINGIDAEALHSERSQGGRTTALKNFKSGKLRVLVATDLASRGLDIQFLPYVINYELPRSPKDYIHRIGRTGRAESSGTAISLICPEDIQHFKVIQKKMGRIVDMTETFDLDLRGY
ncbi:MAG: DEAD/DEAH box helicase [Bacteroidales bacterium]|nr:DEAD/DEAH box helicase [Bacteroidales bacterium]